ATHAVSRSGWCSFASTRPFSSTHLRHVSQLGQTANQRPGIHQLSNTHRINGRASPSSLPSLALNLGCSSMPRAVRSSSYVPTPYLAYGGRARDVPRPAHRSRGTRCVTSASPLLLLLLLTLATHRCSNRTIQTSDSLNHAPPQSIHQSTAAAMSKSRMPLILGLGAAGGIGYYFYSAGGNAKAAENKFESDVHKASASVKSRLPGGSPNAEKELKGYGAEAGAKLDKAVSDTDKQASRLKSNTEAYAKDAKADALKAVDKFDQKVEDGAAKAKSGISGWFGGSSK
ncbi:hypothetical protein TOPH_05589, partial [Tolypocladium ophioglossoides CBS 100239]